MKNKDITELAAILAAHFDNLQLYANGISIKAVRHFTSTESKVYELISKLKAALGTAGLQFNYASQKQLKRLHSALEENRKQIKDEVIQLITESSKEIIQNESNFLRTWWLALLGINLRKLTKEMQESIFKYGKYQGLTQSQIIERVIYGDIDRIYRNIVSGLQDGLSVEAIWKSTQKELQKTRRFVKGETDSIINGVSNDTALFMAANNSQKLLYAAVLDSHVCAECASLNNNVYASDDPDIPALPRHNNCRCHLVPISEDLESNSSDLIMTFTDYFDTLSTDEQIARIGLEKYRLLNDEKYKLASYESPSPELSITMAELKKRDIASFG